MVLSKEAIKEVFMQAGDQTDYVIGLYKLVVPDFDSVEDMGGFPEVNQESDKLIFKLAIDFDKQHHPNVTAGGAWLNYGFNTNDQLQEGQVSLANCNIRYKN